MGSDTIIAFPGETFGVVAVEGQQGYGDRFSSGLGYRWKCVDQYVDDFAISLLTVE